MRRINDLLGVTMSMIGIGGLAGWAESGGGLFQIILALALCTVGPWLLYKDYGTKRKWPQRWHTCGHNPKNTWQF